MSDARTIGVREILANLLRIMRGGGYTDRLLGDIESVSAITSATKSDYGARCRVLHDIVSDSRSWWPEPSDHPDILEFELGVCDAALRIIAARLDGNTTQRSRAHSDLWRHFHSQRERQGHDREKEQARHVDRVVAEAQMRHTEQVRASGRNEKVLTAANDNAESYVYFITDGEAIKIGKANNPRSRLSGLQTSHHKPLVFLATMPGGSELERELHRVFSVFRIRGEWFKDCREIREFIARHNAPKAA